VSPDCDLALLKTAYSTILSPQVMVVVTVMVVIIVGQKFVQSHNSSALCHWFGRVEKNNLGMK
jgi:hypothetical protein